MSVVMTKTFKGQQQQKLGTDMLVNMLVRKHIQPVCWQAVY